jgi:hypothetical protein
MERERKRFIRKGFTVKDARWFAEEWVEDNEAVLRAKFNLPIESVRYTLTYKEFYQFQKLNSFTATRHQAREFFETHKHPACYQD